MTKSTSLLILLFILCFNSYFNITKSGQQSKEQRQDDEEENEEEEVALQKISSHKRV